MAVSDSLLGYDYQVDVSVWLALDLVLERRLADELVIEPEETLEDLQVAISCEDADGHAAFRGAVRWQIQVKHRGSHWVDSDFTNLIFGEELATAARARDAARRAGKPVKPRPAASGRAPPIANLALTNDSYLLVTSAQASVVAAHRVARPGDVPASANPAPSVAVVLSEEKAEGFYGTLTEAEIGISGRGDRLPPSGARGKSD